MIWPSVIEGESLGSYLYRFSESNHYLNVSYIANRINLPVWRIESNDFEERSIDTISRLVNLPQELLLRMSNTDIKLRLEQSSNVTTFLKRRIKYCVDCYTDTRVHYSDWCITPLVYCMSHQKTLVEHCYGCDRKIELKDLMSGCCPSCMSCYHQATANIVDKKTLLYSSQIELLNQLKGLSSDSFFSKYNISEYISIIERSFYLLNGSQLISVPLLETEYFHNKRKGQKTSLHLANAWANVFWMYLDFPMNFHAVLDSFHTNSRLQKRYYTLGRFSELFQKGIFRNIEAAYDEFWVRKLDEGEVRKDFIVFKRAPELLECRKYIRKDEIRNTLGMSYEYIHKLSEDRKLQTVTRKSERSLKWYIERNSLNEVIRQRATLISRKEAALMLGLQRSTIQRIIEAGFLNTYNFTKSGVERLDRDEVERLMDSCRGELVQHIDNDYLRFHKALIKYSVCRMSIDRIIMLTLQGLLNPVCTTSTCNFSDNYYKVSELTQCIEIIKREKGLSS